MTTSPRRVLRYEVPIDDNLHEIAAGKVLMAMPHRRLPSPVILLEVWVETDVELATISGGDGRAHGTVVTGAAETTYVQIYGTGHPLPAEAEHLASCVDGPLVWHLYERTS